VERTLIQDDRLIAIDLGYRTGIAVFSSDGRLEWARSHHFGGISQLRRGSGQILDEVKPSHLVAEGDRRLYETWCGAAERFRSDCQLVGAEIWRKRLLLPREQRTGALAKKSAHRLAYGVIKWSGVRRPHTLRHDAAEAILLGLWGVLELGWLQEVPEFLGPNRGRHRR